MQICGNMCRSCVKTISNGLSSFLMSMEFTAGAVLRNLAEMKRRYPGRFYAFADIDVRNSRAETVDALCRAIDDHALDGIKLHPNNSGLALDSDYNCAIFAFAQERHKNAVGLLG